MLTLTYSHGLGDDLLSGRQGVANAVRSMFSGRWLRDWQVRSTWVGSLRGLDLMVGYNGWHPHIHMLLFVTDAEAASKTLPELIERWRAAVVRVLGEQHAPNDERGVSLEPCHKAQYLLKLGLEITDPSTKVGRNGHRSPWEIAEDIKLYGRDSDKKLWKTYCDGMRGARMLTWSKGLRERLGIGKEKTDEEIAQEEADKEVSPVGLIKGRQWDRLVQRRGAVVHLLEICEQHGWDAAQQFIAKVAEHRRWSAGGNDG
jgi:hypothetical protein